VIRRFLVLSLLAVLAFWLSFPLLLGLVGGASSHAPSEMADGLSDEARELVGADVFEPAQAAALALFARGTEELGELGILLADTKFEFGLKDGKLVLIDEALTPDSSRFWPADEYRIGQNPPSYDKQILRDYLETLDWNKEPPGPELPDEILERVVNRYLEVCEKITGNAPAEVSA